MEAIAEKPPGFDWLAGVKRTTDVPISYFGSWVARLWEPLDNDAVDARLTVASAAAGSKHLENALAATFISNCGGAREYHGLHRMWYISELMRHMPVANYGRCHHNIEWPQGVSKIKLASRHLFYVSFENSIARDYISEKPLQGWMAGSVPVYLGAAAITDFAPAPHSYINALRRRENVITVCSDLQWSILSLEGG